MPHVKMSIFRFASYFFFLFLPRLCGTSSACGMQSCHMLRKLVSWVVRYITWVPSNCTCRIWIFCAAIPGTRPVMSLSWIWLWSVARMARNTSMCDLFPRKTCRTTVFGQPRCHYIGWELSFWRNLPLFMRQVAFFGKVFGSCKKIYKRKW